MKPFEAIVGFLEGRPHVVSTVIATLSSWRIANLGEHSDALAHLPTAELHKRLEQVTNLRYRVSIYNNVIRFLKKRFHPALPKRVRF